MGTPQRSIGFGLSLVSATGQTDNAHAGRWLPSYTGDGFDSIVSLPSCCRGWIVCTLGGSKVMIGDRNPIICSLAILAPELRDESARSAG